MSGITKGDAAGGTSMGGAAGSLSPRERAVVDALLDPWVLLRPVRDAEDAIIDFEYVDVNRLAAQFATSARVDLLGSLLGHRRPELRSAGLVAMLADVVETGVPLVLDEHPYPSTGAATTSRRFDVRASLVAGNVALSWRDATERHEQHQLFELLVNNIADVVLLSRGRHTRMGLPQRVLPTRMEA